jgi:hypothetical protein
LRLAQWLKRLRALLLQAHLVVLVLVLQPAQLVVLVLVVLQPAQQLALLVQLRLVRPLVLLLQPLLLRAASQQQQSLVAWWRWELLPLLLYLLVRAVAVQQPLQQTNLSYFDYPHSLSGDFVFVEGLF